MTFEREERRSLIDQYHTPSRALSVLLHAAGLCSFAYAFNFLYTFTNELAEGFGWHLKFLTIIGLALSAITFILAFMADVFMSDVLFRCKNMLAIVVAPMEVVIAVLYWGISMLFPHSIVPEHLQIPLLADLCFHFFPGVFLMIDALLLSPPWTTTILQSSGTGAALAVSYWMWTEECYKRNGWYPYPFFHDLSTLQRATVFAASALTFVLSSLCMKRLYDIVDWQGIRRKKKIM